MRSLMVSEISNATEKAPQSRLPAVWHGVDHDLNNQETLPVINQSENIFNLHYEKL